MCEQLDFVRRYKQQLTVHTSYSFALLSDSGGESVLGMVDTSRKQMNVLYILLG